MEPGLILRPFSFILLVVFAVTFIACVIPAPSAKRHRPRQANVQSDDTGRFWRRTVDGWEPAASWIKKRDDSLAFLSLSNLHPLVPAALQALISIGALVAFSRH